MDGGAWWAPMRSQRVGYDLVTEHEVSKRRRLIKSIKVHLLLLLLSRFSRVQLCATPWTIAHQAPLSTGFSRQEYQSRLPFPTPAHLPYPGIKPALPVPTPPFKRGESS